MEKHYGIIDLETKEFIWESDDVILAKQMIDMLQKDWFMRRGRPYKLMLIEFTELGRSGNDYAA